MLTTKFALIFWLTVAPPIMPQKIPLGPFDSAQQCEDAFKWANARYLGTGYIGHICQPMS